MLTLLLHISPPFQVPFTLSIVSHSLPLSPPIVPFLIADIKMAKFCPLMRRDIPGVSQMSALLCGNPTLVESIFLGKKRQLAVDGAQGHLQLRRSGDYRSVLEATQHRPERMSARTHPNPCIHTEQVARLSPRFHIRVVHSTPVTPPPPPPPPFPAASPVHAVMSRMMRGIR